MSLPRLTGRQIDALIAIHARGASGVTSRQMRNEGFSLAILWALERKGFVVNIGSKIGFGWFLTIKGVNIASGFPSVA